MHTAGMTKTQTVATDRGQETARQTWPVVAVVAAVMAGMLACLAGAFLAASDGAGVLQLAMAAAGIVAVTGVVCLVVAAAIDR